MAAAAFYDLEGTLVSTNLVHTLGFYAKNQQGLFRSFKKAAATVLSIPVFAVTDQYSRQVFNDLFFKRYKGETEDRLRSKCGTPILPPMDEMLTIRPARRRRISGNTASVV